MKTLHTLTLFHGLLYLGGRWWHCVRCDRPIEARYDGCAPPAHACQKAVA